MSQLNGDKARFNRERKQNIQRRKRNKALFEAATANGGSPATAKKPASGTDGGKHRD